MHYLVLVKGEAIGFFSGSRGLHKGDVLSPTIIYFGDVDTTSVQEHRYQGGSFGRFSNC